MRIVIDGRLWSESGLGRYIRNLVFNLQKIDQENEYIILLIKKDFDKLNFEKNFSKKLVDIRWYTFQEQLQLPKVLKSLKPDLVHFPHFNVPILYKGKFLVTIHDLIHQHFKTRDVTTRNPFYFKFKQIAYHQAFSKALINSRKIITPTKFVKNQLVDEWKVNENKIEVTYEGVDESIIQLVNKKQDSSINGKYIFYIGNAQPHKNLPFLIENFLEIKDRFEDLKLVLAGPNHLFWDRIKQKYPDKSIVYKGFVSEEEMVELYQNAEMFVLPSLEEGFGIPVLEAMACGTPVVCSNIGSLKEVGGGAALYFDPTDKADFQEKLVIILNNKRLKTELINNGKSRYQTFSWESMAIQTQKIYRSLT